MKFLNFFLIILLILPLASAGGIYDEGNYGATLYGQGETEEGGDDGGGGGGGGGGEATLECILDSDCGEQEYCFDNKCNEAECVDDSVCNTNKGETCFNYRCVKLFDMEILEFESPVNLGEFFDFIYFVKAVAEIDGDVEIKFWIEQNKQKFTSGQDTIYLGSYDEKTKTKKLFLPEDMDSGTYEFYIEVTYGTYTASAHRTIGITVEDGAAVIKLKPKTSTLMIFISSGLAGLILILLAIIFAMKRKRKRAPTSHHSSPKKKITKRRRHTPKQKKEDLNKLIRQVKHR